MKAKINLRIVVFIIAIILIAVLIFSREQKTTEEKLAAGSSQPMVEETLAENQESQKKNISESQIEEQPETEKFLEYKDWCNPTSIPVNDAMLTISYFDSVFAELESDPGFYSKISPLPNVPMVVFFNAYVPAAQQVANLSVEIRTTQNSNENKFSKAFENTFYNENSKTLLAFSWEAKAPSSGSGTLELKASYEINGKHQTQCMQRTFSVSTASARGSLVVSNRTNMFFDALAGYGGYSFNATLKDIAVTFSGVPISTYIYSAAKPSKVYSMDVQKNCKEKECKIQSTLVDVGSSVAVETIRTLCNSGDDAYLLYRLSYNNVIYTNYEKLDLKKFLKDVCPKETQLIEVIG